MIDTGKFITAISDNLHVSKKMKTETKDIPVTNVMEKFRIWLRQQFKQFIAKCVSFFIAFLEFVHLLHFNFIFFELYILNNAICIHLCAHIYIYIYVD